MYMIRDRLLWARCDRIIAIRIAQWASVVRWRFWIAGRRHRLPLCGLTMNSLTANIRRRSFSLFFGLDVLFIGLRLVVMNFEARRLAKVSSSCTLALEIINGDLA